MRGMVALTASLLLSVQSAARGSTVEVAGEQFASLHDAFAAVAAARIKLGPDGDPARGEAILVSEPTQVLLGPGTHRLPRPLVISAAHGHVHVKPAGSPGSAPVISGGHDVEGWAAVAGGLWTAPLPAGVEFSRQLWVNGVRRNRTVIHSTDCCTVKPTNPQVFALGGETFALETITAGGYTSNSSALKALRNKADVELLFTRIGSSWTEGRCTLADITDAGELLVKQPCFATQRNRSYGQAVTFPRSLENLAMPAHDMPPGSWYSDRAGRKLFFKPTKADLAAG